VPPIPFWSHHLYQLLQSCHNLLQYVLAEVDDVCKDFALGRERDVLLLVVDGRNNEGWIIDPLGYGSDSFVAYEDSTTSPPSWMVCERKTSYRDDRCDEKSSPRWSLRLLTTSTISLRPLAILSRIGKAIDPSSRSTAVLL